ncbi:MAG: bifunctional phosphoribosyl-AMP cyclohydrolase/phosphoribosyl-ATP diphosphatase HisIE [Bacteroidetes bacterium]|nr:bifunctional phosphoribosyl-AMP cyclohydrolase/phosphoribosyl-ATP diphosphatase HisIE [Bacteroidota bacterium]
MNITKINEQGRFDKETGLIPAIIQDNKTGVVLMLAYMNKKSLKQTAKTGKVTFFSRSRKKIWVKGETSGNSLKLRSIKLDCDKDTLLVKVDPAGPVCHTGAETCWGEMNNGEFNYLVELENVIRDRKKNPQANSYTNRLINRGLNKIAQKVGEEAVEVVIEAKDDNPELFKSEVSDLLYHLSLLIVEKGTSWEETFDTLRARRK